MQIAPDDNRSTVAPTYLSFSLHFHSTKQTQLFYCESFKYIPESFTCYVDKVLGKAEYIYLTSVNGSPLSTTPTEQNFLESYHSILHTDSNMIAGQNQCKIVKITLLHHFFSPHSAYKLN